MEKETEDKYKASPLEEFFFLRRVPGLLLLMLLCVGGVLTFSELDKEDMPDIKIPFATIQTEWPGGDPDSVEKRISNKIEEKVKATPNLKRYESASYNSFSIITAEFYPEEDPDLCLANLRNELDKVEDLPSDAKKPILAKASVTDTPILTINLFGEISASMKNRAAQALKDELLMIPGTRAVNINGERKDEIFIMLNLDTMQSLGISPEDVRNALVEAHIDMPLEEMESDVFSSAIKLKGRFREASDMMDLIVTRIGDRPIALREVADVRRDLAQKKNMIRMSYHGSEFREAISLDILKSPGADTLGIIRAAKKKLSDLTRSDTWPSGLESRITEDNSLTIEDSLNDVYSNGFQAIALVALVLLAALTWREALVASISIPVTLLGVMTLLPLLGYTFNKMVVIGMVLALGMLVDVFILMMEGMHDGIFAERLGFKDSAVRTVRTYALAAFTGQLTTIFAFLPLALIPGVSGKFIRIIPVIVSASLLISFVVAIFIDVPLSWFFFRSVGGVQAKKSLADKIFDSVSKAFSGLLSSTVIAGKSSAAICVAIFAVALLASLYSAKSLRNEMFPKGDSLTLGVNIELSPDATLLDAETVAAAMGELFRKKGYIESVVSYAGKRSPMAKNAQLQVRDAYYLVGYGCRFVPKGKRPVKESYKYLPELRKEAEELLSKVAPGAKIQFFVETGGSSSNAPVQLRLVSSDVNALRMLSRKMQDSMAKIRGTSDISDNIGPSRISVDLEIDREMAQFHKISADSIGRQLRAATGYDEIALFPADDSKEELKIRLGTKWRSRHGAPGGPMSIDEISKVILVNSEGKCIQLPMLLRHKVGETPLSITHYNGARTVVISSEAEDRPALEIVSEIESVIEKMKNAGEWPSGVSYSFGGELEEMDETYGGIWKIVAVAIFLVFAVLAFQFGNFLQPFIIFSSVPASLIGVIFGFQLMDISFSFPAAIGVISLTGIVVNNAIVMIETMNSLVKEGKSASSAAVEGTASRLRPIALTTLTTVVGLIPLSLSDPMWKPLCMAIVLGLSASTVICLFLTPALFFLMSGSAGNGKK